MPRPKKVAQQPVTEQAQESDVIESSPKKVAQQPVTEQFYPGVVTVGLSESLKLKQLDYLKKREIAVKTGDVPMMTGNRDESYLFPEWEGKLVHARIIKKAGNSNKSDMVEEDGVFFEKKKMIKSIWKGNVRQFERMSKGRIFSGFQSVTILHDPRNK